MKTSRYRVVIEKTIRETHEVIIESTSGMEAFDEATRLINKRNENQSNKYHITKVEKEQNNE